MVETRAAPMDGVWVDMRAASTVDQRAVQKVVQRALNLADWKAGRRAVTSVGYLAAQKAVY